jgi:hypothetical protein
MVSAVDVEKLTRATNIGLSRLEDCKRAREHKGQHEKWARTMNRTTLAVGFLSTSTSGKNHKNICTLSSAMVSERSSHQHPPRHLRRQAVEGPQPLSSVCSKKNGGCANDKVNEAKLCGVSSSVCEEVKTRRGKKARKGA